MIINIFATFPNLEINYHISIHSKHHILFPFIQAIKLIYIYELTSTELGYYRNHNITTTKKYNNITKAASSDYGEKDAHFPSSLIFSSPLPFFHFSFSR